MRFYRLGEGEAATTTPEVVEIVPVSEDQAMVDYINAFFSFDIGNPINATPAAQQAGDQLVSFLRRAAIARVLQKDTPAAEQAMKEFQAYRAANFPMPSIYIDQMVNYANLIMETGELPDSMARGECAEGNCPIIYFDKPKVTDLDITDNGILIMQSIVDMGEEEYLASRAEEIEIVKQMIANGEFAGADQEALLKQALDDKKDLVEFEKILQKEVDDKNVELSSKMDQKIAKEQELATLRGEVPAQNLSGGWRRVSLGFYEPSHRSFALMNRRSSSRPVYAPLKRVVALDGLFSSVKKFFSQVGKEVARPVKKFMEEVNRFGARVRKEAYRVSKRLAPFIGPIEFLAPILGLIPVIGQILVGLVLLGTASIEIHFTYKQKQLMKKKFAEIMRAVMAAIAEVDEQIRLMDIEIEKIKAQRAFEQRIFDVERSQREALIAQAFGDMNNARRAALGLALGSAGVLFLGSRRGWNPFLTYGVPVLGLAGAAYMMYEKPLGLDSYDQCMKNGEGEQQCFDAWALENFGRFQ